MIRGMRERAAIRSASTLLVAALAFALMACGSTDEGRRPVILAATTSTQDSGLLDVLVPAFESESGWEVRTIAVGSGQAIALGRRGEADVVLAHSPADERRLMSAGLARSRRLVMANDFVLVGPRADPAAAAGLPLPEALTAIARRQAPFVSRGDASGTHAFELDLWKRAGVAPRGSWYQETGQGQSATLRLAAERGGYAITDRATYLATRADEDLAVIAAGGRALDNPYHVIDLTSRAGGSVNAEGARALADWLVGPRAQALIGAFGRREHGRPLFEPRARPDDG